MTKYYTYNKQSLIHRIHTLLDNRIGVEWFNKWHCHLDSYVISKSQLLRQHLMQTFIEDLNMELNILRDTDTNEYYLEQLNKIDKNIRELQLSYIRKLDMED